MANSSIPGHTYSDLPEVYHDRTANLPEVVPVDGSYKHAVTPDTSTYPEVRHAPNADGSGEKSERRVCGLKRKLFFILVAIAAIIVIGAVVGGAVGATVNKDSSTSTSDPTSSTASSTATATGSEASATSQASSILSNSGIASVNWTDSDNYSHYYVFHQNRTNDIIASFWDSQNKTWETGSISASLRKSGVTLDIIEGTPITAVAWTDSDNDWNIRLYVLLTSNSIAELYTSDPTKDGQWYQNSLGSQTTINTAYGSNIAAWHPNDGNSSWPPTVLMWQDEDQKIVYSSSDDWTSKTAMITATNSSGIAISSIASGGDTSEVRWRFYYDNSGIISEGMLYEDLSGWLTHTGLGKMPSSSLTNFAAVCFDLVLMIVADIHDEGNVVARWWNKTEWSTPTQPTFHDLPSGMNISGTFTGISGHADNKMYGIVDSEIHEWSFKTKTPMNWKYSGQVKTTLDE
ncbi:hypothetical protein EDB81DRAFT_859614 [Dactylonectria macrodidyma]|uniref:Fucose-specific lectin n=1 Tax=Dactylonectria macrodidyma TaxID=307937 RepID=A0A9P9E4K3_9HYPO|nr:hypothetical protein EDB81DRAFT_859614 [Dactylonectria macrodidyma]